MTSIHKKLSGPARPFRVVMYGVSTILMVVVSTVFGQVRLEHATEQDHIATGESSELPQLLNEFDFELREYGIKTDPTYIEETHSWNQEYLERAIREYSRYVDSVKSSYRRMFAEQPHELNRYLTAIDEEQRAADATYNELRFRDQTAYRTALNEARHNEYEEEQQRQAEEEAWQEELEAREEALVEQREAVAEKENELDEERRDQIRQRIRRSDGETFDVFMQALDRTADALDSSPNFVTLPPEVYHPIRADNYQLIAQPDALIAFRRRAAEQALARVLSDTHTVPADTTVRFTGSGEK